MAWREGLLLWEAGGGGGCVPLARSFSAKGGRYVRTPLWDMSLPAGAKRYCR